MIILIILTIFFLTFILSNVLLSSFVNKEKLKDKLKYFDDDFATLEKYEKPQKKRIKPFKLISDLIPGMKLNKKRSEKAEIELVRADMPITADELFAIKILSSSSFAFLSFSIFRSIIILPIVFFSVWNLPGLIIAKRKKERIKLFNGQLYEGMMIIANSLKAGYSFLQAVGVVTEETKDPFSKEFKKLLKEMTLGISEEDALKNLLLRMQSEDLRLIINAILIQKDIGGNLSEILDNISETIRERQKIKNELKTLTAQGRLSGIIVALIPVFLAVIIYMFNRDYMSLLFTTHMGLAMVGGAVVNEFFGLLLIKKIINIEM